MNQIISVIGAFMLLSLLTLGINRSVAIRTQETYASESLIAATTEAQALLQEVVLQAFDQNTLPPGNGASISSPTQLTPSAALGPDPGEFVVSQFNDLDDYKGYVRFDTVKSAILKDSVDVYYVYPNALDTQDYTRTYYKKIIVTVWNIDPKVEQPPVTLSTLITF